MFELEKNKFCVTVLKTFIIIYKEIHARINIKFERFPNFISNH